MSTLPNAYWLSGHGNEPNDGRTFKVPAGCTIVVKAAPGEITYSSAHYFQKACGMNKQKLKDPSNNINYIIQKFKSVVIYKAGDDCPFFTYSLIACYPTEGEPTDYFNHCNNMGSGVLNIDNNNNGYCNTAFETRLENVQTKTSDIIMYIINLYKNSVYPTSLDIKNAISNLTIPEDSAEWIALTKLEKQNWILDKIKSYTFDTNQEFLCLNYPGVYYNFICRYRGDETYDVYNRDPIFTRNRFHRYTAVQGKRTFRVRNMKKRNNKTLRLIGNRIGEAELKRRVLLKQYYNTTIPEDKKYRNALNLYEKAEENGLNTLNPEIRRRYNEASLFLDQNPMIGSRVAVENAEDLKNRNQERGAAPNPNNLREQMSRIRQQPVNVNWLPKARQKEMIKQLVKKQQIAMTKIISNDEYKITHLKRLVRGHRYYVVNKSQPKIILKNEGLRFISYDRTANTITFENPSDEKADDPIILRGLSNYNFYKIPSSAYRNV
jgi:hypothetical protein